MRILIVDDVPDNIRILSRMLADEGHDISASTNGQEALMITESVLPDLILLDVMMPGMDGYAICAALKANPRLKSIPVIFVTALSDTEDETRGLSLGAVDYIAKPFKEVIVKLRVRTHLELKQQRDLLGRLSAIDGLTGIPNRRAFDERLDAEWRRAIRVGGALALTMIDIDYFKAFNDSHGHLEGDECLRRVAKTLEAAARRGEDFVGRYGGEEFVFLSSSGDQAGMAGLVETLRVSIEALRIPHGASEVASWVTVSSGVALCRPTPEMQATDLLASADAELYKAKHRGRNCVSVTTVTGVSGSVENCTGERV
ncbi:MULTISPECIES: diguanylate cyclase domain-containing protein [unclassified Thiocapsa]|uniref:diguanylate cyclase domain-containing protein n=1 Tax=unclassified Thiocapsa TaxID=2641286 RepID=UPI0035B43273